MKKMLKISLVAVFAVMPLLAHAAAGDVNKQPTHAETASDSNVANTDPQYALATANAQTDGNVATAGYVKGAYNASIRAINKVASDVAGINTDLQNVATKTGVVATVNHATATYTPSGSVSSVTIDAMKEWGSDTAGTVTVPAATFTGTEATINIQVDDYYTTMPSDEDEDDDENGGDNNGDNGGETGNEIGGGGE